MKVLDHLEEWFIATLMGAATIIIFVAVVHRYAAGLPIPGLQNWLISLNLSWAQELCIYMFVWMAKFGAAYGVRTGIHVGVDVLINRLPDTWRKKAVLMGLSCGVIFTGIIGTLGANFVWENGMHYAVYTALGIATGDVPQGPTSPDLELPTWIVYLAIPLGSYLMCFRFLQVTWHFARHGDLPHHDHANIDGLGDEDVGDHEKIEHIKSLSSAKGGK
jgi:C4-dicarboxylate transporter DctQ subunit